MPAWLVPLQKRCPILTKEPFGEILSPHYLLSLTIHYSSNQFNYLSYQSSENRTCLSKLKALYMLFPAPVQSPHSGTKILFTHKAELNKHSLLTTAGLVIGLVYRAWTQESDWIQIPVLVLSSHVIPGKLLICRIHQDSVSSSIKWR